MRVIAVSNDLILSLRRLLALPSLIAYRPGWKPTNGGVLLNLKVYKNNRSGIKFHTTENVVIKGGLFADNFWSIRYQAFNGQVTVQDVVIDAYSDDYYYRIKDRSSCPFTQYGISTSVNGDVDPNKSIPDALALRNVTFKNFEGCSNVKTIAWNFHDLNYNERGMGDPITATGLTMVNSPNLPYFPCWSTMEHAYMEDVGGVLGPDGYGPGFIVANRPHMTEFLPEGSCHAVQSGGCSVFCEGACLRAVEIEPISGDPGVSFKRLTLTNQEGKSYMMNYNGRNKPTEVIFFTVLPSGEYTGTFRDEAGVEVKPDYVNVRAHTLPQCLNYVTEEMFSFDLATEPPSQSAGPTPAPPDRFCHGGIEGTSTSGVDVCCAASCGRCGGSGCYLLPGGSASCCSGTISTSGSVCDGFADVGCIMPAAGWCEYGVLNGNVCCAGSCGTCGGGGCGNRPGGYSKCCGGAITNSGNVCDSFEETACVVEVFER